MNLLDSEIEYDSIYEDEEDLDGFIVDNEPVQDRTGRGVTGNSESEADRMNDITNISPRGNETQAQRLLKAHISILVSALGGPDHTASTSPPPYKLGHDALACLRDIKRWIKSVDERTNSFDVAIACAESGLLTNDLVTIICQYDSQMASKQPIHNPRATEKIMLACLELMLLLTWPIDINSQLSDNQKLLYSDVLRYQLAYKAVILLYNNGQTLRAVIRLALPAIAKSKADREPRDNAITRLVMYLVRNILYIEPQSSSVLVKSRKQMGFQDSMPTGVLQEDISLATVLDKFKKNNVLMLLLTISGSMGIEFDRDVYGPICLECLFLITRGVQVVDLLAPKQHNKPRTGDNDALIDAPLESITTTAGMQLSDLLSNEASRKKAKLQVLPTRHSRFGSLLSIRSNDAPSYVISGQEALHGTESSFAMLDKSKKWKARSGFKYDSDEFCSSSRVVYLNHAGRLLLRDFVESMLSGGCFNNLIESVGSIFAGSGDVNYIGEYEKACFFLTIAWFFAYKREKATRLTSGGTQPQANSEIDSADYGSVGAALSEVNFVLIISYFRESFSNKHWSSLHVAMKCFRELLYVSHSLFGKMQVHEDDLDSQDSTDRQLAEGIIRKLFSFNDFLNIIVLLPRTAAKHSPDYLNVCISVVHIVLKCFDSFANEDLKVYVRTERLRSRRKQPKVSNLDKDTENQFREIIDDSDEEENEERMRLIKQERKLDLHKVESRFFATLTVSTHIDYLSRYEDLSHEEIKRCLSYFHRLFVVNKDYTSLYRLDFMHVIHQLRNFLPRATSIRKHVEDFIGYFMKKFKVAFDRYPMPIEVLFPRLEQIECKTFLATGELLEAPQKGDRAASAKLAKNLEFIKDDFTLEEKIKILVSALWSQEKYNLLDWTQSELKRIEEARILSVDVTEDEILRPKPDVARLLITNEFLRHLFTLVGVTLPFTLGDPCFIPPSVNTEHLAQCNKFISKWVQQQPVSFEDGKPASFFLRPLEADTHPYDYLDDQLDGVEFAEYERKNQDGERHFFTELDKLDDLEKRLDKASHRSNSEELERGHARTKKANRAKKVAKERMEKRIRDPDVSTSQEKRSLSRFVSDAWVHDSDDESNDEKDREFFEREQKLRQMLPDTGLVTSAQLEEFKAAWSKLKSRNAAISHKVHDALKDKSLFKSQLEDDDDDDDDEDEMYFNTTLNQINSTNSGSSGRLAESHNNIEASPQADKISGSELPRTVKRRRKMVLSDDEE